LSVSALDPIHGSCDPFPSLAEANGNTSEWNWPGTIPDFTRLYLKMDALLYPGHDVLTIITQCYDVFDKINQQVEKI
jgi:hypothetical protein